MFWFVLETRWTRHGFTFPLALTSQCASVSPTAQNSARPPHRKKEQKIQSTGEKASVIQNTSSSFSHSRLDRHSPESQTGRRSEVTCSSRRGGGTSMLLIKSLGGGAPPAPQQVLESAEKCLPDGFSWTLVREKVRTELQVGFKTKDILSLRNLFCCSPGRQSG